MSFTFPTKKDSLGDTPAWVTQAFNARTHVYEDPSKSKILFLWFQVICQIIADENDKHFNEKDDMLS